MRVVDGAGPSMKEDEDDIAAPGDAADQDQADANDAKPNLRADRATNAPGGSGIEPMTFGNPEAQQDEERDKTRRARAKNVVLRSIVKTGWWWPDGS